MDRFDTKEGEAKKSLTNRGILQIKTVPDGFNFGRAYYFKENNETSCRRIVSELSKDAETARKLFEKKSRFKQTQEFVRVYQEAFPFQITVALLIVMVSRPYRPSVMPFGRSFSDQALQRANDGPPAHTQNFLVNIAEAEFPSSLINSDGTTSTRGAALERADAAFTIVFALELAVNAYAHWLRPFLADGWNLFDCVVVLLSLIALGPISVPVNVVRSLRAFRVVRLFGRMGALRDIISSLYAATMPVLNTFIILLIISAICERCAHRRRRRRRRAPRRIYAPADRSGAAVIGGPAKTGRQKRALLPSLPASLPPSLPASLSFPLSSSLSLTHSLHV